jgi:hypothetical protein
MEFKPDVNGPPPPGAAAEPDSVGPTFLEALRASTVWFTARTADCDMFLDHPLLTGVSVQKKTTLNQAPKSVISGQHNTGVVQVLTDAVTAADLDGFRIASDGEWVIMAPSKLPTDTIIQSDDRAFCGDL